MLVDSNIIIYAAQPRHVALRQFFRTHAPVVSVISYVEVLGFHRLKEAERRRLERFFGAAEIFPLSDPVVQQAVELRRRKRMCLGDSIIAATAVVWERTLVTHNVEDFSWIEELTILDPLAASP